LRSHCRLEDSEFIPWQGQETVHQNVGTGSVAHTGKGYRSSFSRVKEAGA